jgi:hypothetical protein
MKVYIVDAGDYEDNRIVRVFAEADDAKAFCLRWNRREEPQSEAYLGAPCAIDEFNDGFNARDGRYIIEGASYSEWAVESAGAPA